MKLLPDTDPILTTPSEPLSKAEIKSNETKQLAKDLFKVMVDNKGMGISAVQVGVLKRLFIVHVPGFSEVCINPAILQKSHVRCDFVEGCLSFGEKLIKVSRPESIKVKFIDTNGKLVYRSLDGLAARVFQHEHDHLRGVVFTSYENL